MTCPISSPSLSTTTAISHPSFPIPLFAQLAQRLRHTNARYNQIAHQCRRAQRPTHYAKRRAYRAGLCIDTSKACAAWLDNPISTTPQIPALCSTADGPAIETESKIKIETEENDSGQSTEDGYMPPLGLGHYLSKVAVVEEQLMALGSLSPLLLAYDPFSFEGPVPRAPRWRPVPLPEDERGAMAFENQPSGSCTYKYNVGKHGNVSDSVSTSADVMHYAGLGITVQPRH